MQCQRKYERESLIEKIDGKIIMRPARLRTLEYLATGISNFGLGLWPRLQYTERTQ